MFERTVLEIANPVTQTVKALAQQLITMYPTGFLSEIVWPCRVAIQILECRCLDTSRAIIRGYYQGARVFGTACQMTRAARIPFSSPVGTPVMAEALNGRPKPF